ncbi:cationic amino acid transporter 9 chloroplastic isoform X1 [Tripterygium wilfordii]|uniref:Cationic amino acid transporter 9 chloroplastic isoform X1 n=1 Tax=Tripterygium wilfordii TaxID=458696 RepID=A0A7J7CCF4_TRIWF|nr:cationic amino acid transporter 9 chloroplastic isoform X1 [Tripterygium wilfordii]
MGGQRRSHGTDLSASSSSWLSRFWSSALRTKTFGSPTSAADFRTSSGEGVGASIGAGIFVVTGTVARDAGPGVTISFIVAGASCILNALCYAELASRVPAVVGGAYLYAYVAFNELTAFLVFAQLMLDYHVAAASIARSLAAYIITILELFPFFKDIPGWVGQGEEFLGGALSINILAPIVLAILTAILCWGVGESSALNSFMTVTKVVIVIFVIFAGAFEVDISNWSPFAPNGFKAILTGATVVFFSYVGFDAVANSAEESKNPQFSLGCMVPYHFLGEDAPLAEAFTSKGLKYVSVLISIGAVAGLSTTLLVGLYVQQSRLYLGLGRDGLLPSVFAKVHPTRHTPVFSQVWVGIIAGVLAGLFNVRELSHILSVGSLTGYSVVAACVVVCRSKDKTASLVSSEWITAWREGVLCLIIVAFSGFGSGVLYRVDASFVFLLVAAVIALLASAALLCRQRYVDPPGFSCPGVPIVPAIFIFLNIFLFAQLHYEAWVRFIILSLVAVGIYAFYGQYHAEPRSNEAIIYHRAPAEAS